MSPPQRMSAKAEGPIEESIALVFRIASPPMTVIGTPTLALLGRDDRRGPLSSPSGCPRLESVGIAKEADLKVERPVNDRAIGGQPAVGDAEDEL
jgi:hypothetical protein